MWCSLCGSLPNASLEPFGRVSRAGDIMRCHEKPDAVPQQAPAIPFGHGGGWFDRQRAKGVLNPCTPESGGENREVPEEKAD